MARELTVELGARSYPIRIGAGLLEDPGAFAASVRGRRALVVTNETVGPLWQAPVLRALASAGIEADPLILPDGEAHKNLATLERIFDALVDGRHDRDTTLVALGGGVVGDLTGFAAACWHRGVDFVQVPTTLLAQVDSSVGGKTAVNHPRGKNLIGAFHQPRAVLADTDALGTLPEREYAAGLAEVVKYGAIADEPFLRWLEAHRAALLAREAGALTEAVACSCAIKADVVARDEREQDVRALLNFGHTFGHAIEALTDYSTWLHGEAVAAGMVMAAELSRRIGWLSDDAVGRLAALLAAFGLPTWAPPELVAEPERFRDAMALDKKARDGTIRLVLLERTGLARVTADHSGAALSDVLARPAAGLG